MQPETIQQVRVHIPKPEPTIEDMAAERAASDPLPGPLSAAFISDSIEVAGMRVRKLVASDYVVFKFLDSPILRQLLELAKPEDAREDVIANDTEEWEMVWQFTNNPRKVRDAMAKGREFFSKSATDEVGDRLSPEQLKIVMLAIFEQIKRSAESSVAFVTDAKEKGEITFFREQK